MGTGVSWIQLQAACFEENAQNVRVLLDAKTNVNHASSAGHTPLHIAVRKRNIHLVTLLLDQNADVNCKTIEGKTALHIAVDKCEETIVQKILAQNADPSLKDTAGNTSLHLAVQLKLETTPRLQRVEMSYPSCSPASYRCSPVSYRACSAHTVRTIIEHGADVNTVNNRGQTALWFACIDNQENFVKILLDAGADPNITDTGNDSSLHSAINGYCSIDSDGTY